MDKYTVYKHTFPNDKVYIGITCQKLKKRWQSGWGYEHQTLVFNAIKKYGWNNIKHEVLFDNLTLEEAESKEIELIKMHRSTERTYGYNISNGGNHKGKVSEETKAKISASNTGKSRGKPSWNKGRKWTDEERLALKNGHKGQKAWNKGIPTREETKIKLRNAELGKYIPPETRQRMSEAHSLPVECIETGIVYASARLAAEMTNITSSNITRNCNGKRKSAGGFHWRFAGKEVA